MNTHRIEVHNIGGMYTGHYPLIWDTEGNPVRFCDARDARIATFEARDAAEEGRFTHWRGVPQIRPTPKFHEARSRAGKRAWANQRWEAMKGAAE